MVRDHILLPHVGLDLETGVKIGKCSHLPKPNDFDCYRCCDLAF